MTIMNMVGGMGGKAVSEQTVIDPAISSVIPFPPIRLTSEMVGISGLKPGGISPTSYETITRGQYAYSSSTGRREGCGAYGTRNFGLDKKNEPRSWSIDEAHDFQFTGISFNPSSVTSMFEPSDTPYEIDMVANGIFDLPVTYSGRTYHNYLTLGSELDLKLKISKNESGNNLVELVSPISVHINPYTCTWGGTNLPFVTPIIYLTVLKTP